MQVTRSQIISDLRALGVSSHDALLVHSSLKSLGRVQGGAWTVIEALAEIIRPGGTLVMPTFSYSFIRGEGDDRYMEYPPYHPLRTPSRVGAITEFFRFYPGVIRSEHPTHSVAALGKKADLIVFSHSPKDSPFARNSPFGKMAEIDAWIMFLGCGLGPNSTLHAVEDWLDMPYMTRCLAEAVLIDEKNNLRTVEFAKEPRGHRSFYQSDSDFIKKLMEKEVFRVGKVCRASVYLAKMRKMIRSVLEILIDNPAAMLCDNVDCEFCQTGRADIAEHYEQIKSNIVDELNVFGESCNE